MSERDRLLDILMRIPGDMSHEAMADWLLANGVAVPDDEKQVHPNTDTIDGIEFWGLRTFKEG